MEITDNDSKQTLGWLVNGFLVVALCISGYAAKEVFSIRVELSSLQSKFDTRGTEIERRFSDLGVRLNNIDNKLDRLLERRP